MKAATVIFKLFGFWIALACILPAPALADTIFNIDLGAGNFGNLDQDDTTACADVACGPTAAVNSFVFLQNKYPDIYNSSLLLDNNVNGFDYQDLIDTADALSDPAFMDCAVCFGGTLRSKFISGKQDWIEMRVPGVTVYQDLLNPTWQFLYGELVDMEDVELLFGFYDAAGNRVGGHYVTLTSFMWTDVNMDGVVDVGEGATIGFIDAQTGLPATQGLFQNALGTALRTDYNIGGNVGQTRIDVAVSESPIPEPSTVMLVGAGLGCLLMRRRKRNRVSD
jgi:hypothetical protein